MVIHGYPMTTPWMRRALAVALGLALAGLALGGFIYWNVSYVHGSQECARCHWQRSVDRRGPFWFVSEPSAPARAERSAEVACAEHDWKRVGCWFEGGMVRCGPLRE